MAEKNSIVNMCNFSGKLFSVQGYKTRNGDQWHRMMIYVPALNEFSHPTKICVHTQSLKGRSPGQMVDLVASASTYIAVGPDSNGVIQEYDNTRLYEMA
jgi:hypothetical protein